MWTRAPSGAGSVGSQMISTGSVDPKTLGIDLATAYALKGRGFTANVLGNTASGAFNSYVTDQSVVNGAIGSGVGSLIGYGTGKIVELPLNKKFNPDPIWLKYNPQPLSNEIPFIYSYKKNILPAVWGNSVGEVFNRGFQIQYEFLNKGSKMNKLKFALCMAIYSLLVSFLAVYGSFFLANVLYNFNSGNSLLDFDFSGFFLNGFKTSIKMIILLWGLLFVSSYFGYGKKYNIF